MFACIDISAIPADEQELFGRFASALMKSASIDFVFKLELCLVLVLHFSKVQEDFPKHSLIYKMVNASPEVNEKKIQEWEICVRKQFVHRNNVFVSDPSYNSEEYSISTSTIREQHAQMLSNVNRMSNEMLDLERNTSNEIRKLNCQVTSLEGKITSLEGTIASLKDMLSLVCNHLNVNVSSVTPSATPDTTIISGSRNTLQTMKRSHCGAEEEHPTKRQKLTHTILDSFSGISLANAFFSYYVDNLPSKVRSMVGPEFQQQRSNFNKIQRTVRYMKSFQKTSTSIDPQPSALEVRSLQAWIEHIRNLSLSLEEETWNWLQTKEGKTRLTRACKSCGDLLFSKYKDVLPTNELLTDNFDTEPVLNAILRE